jgi:hypothetical protein
MKVKKNVPKFKKYDYTSLKLFGVIGLVGLFFLVVGLTMESMDEDQVCYEKIMDKLDDDTLRMNIVSVKYNDFNNEHRCIMNTQYDVIGDAGGLLLIERQQTFTYLMEDPYYKGYHIDSDNVQEFILRFGKVAIFLTGICLLIMFGDINEYRKQRKNIKCKS